MPLVSESMTAKSVMYAFKRSDGRDLLVNIPTGENKHQTGYRSGPLSKEVRMATDGRTDQSWKDTLRVIQGYDYEYNTRADRVSSVVNPRDYTSTGAGVTVFPWTDLDPYGRTLKGTTGVSCEPYASGAFDVSESLAASVASDMMRSSVPTAPAFELVRSLAELRDFPSMLRAKSYLPQKGRDAGDAYLNQVFGLQPTGKDIASLANAVISSGAIASRFLEHENHRLSRRRSQELTHERFATEILPPPNAGTYSVSLRFPASVYWGSVVLYATPESRYVGGYSYCPIKYIVTGEVTSSVRMFATFEYFIPRPTGFPGRLDLYRRKAESVLGSGLSPSAMYALTPWTWLADWFVDIGGLLRYQDYVAASSVVASRSGWVSETTQTLIATSSSLTSNDEGTGHQHTASAFSQMRRAGGPYSILQPWSLSSGQGAIATALAVSRYSPV